MREGKLQGEATPDMVREALKEWPARALGGKVLRDDGQT